MHRNNILPHFFSEFVSRYLRTMTAEIVCYASCMSHIQGTPSIFCQKYIVIISMYWNINPFRPLFSSHQTSPRQLIRNNVTSHLLTCLCNSFRWSMHLSCFGHAVNWCTGRLAIGLVIIWFKTYSFCVLLLFYVDTVKNKLIICRTS